MRWGFSLVNGSMTENSYIHQQIGNYRLVQLLAHSDCSDIYLGEHVYFHTHEAIKVLDGQHTRQDVAKFLAQASVLTHLRHPYIIQVLDFGLQEDIAFLVMDYAPNGTLRQRHPKNTLVPLEIVLSYVKHVATALEYIHQHKLIHRDIKPQNMLVGPNDEIMLGDFGIAVVYEDAQPDLYDFEGTVLYAAPEQLQGQPQFNSDQYALAVVVYEWLCGARPFSGNFDDVVNQHLFMPPPPLCEQNAALPLAIEDVVHRALAKEPGARFPDVRAFAEALEKAGQRQLTGPFGQLKRVQSMPTAPEKVGRQFLSPLPFRRETP